MTGSSWPATSATPSAILRGPAAAAAAVRQGDLDARKPRAVDAPQDPVQLRGEARYQALVRMCQDNDIVTPEDEFASGRARSVR